jgi:hypothetical protein
MASHIMNPEEQLQARLSRMEDGESFEAGAVDLPADELELLNVATALHAMIYPAQTAESITAQRAILLKTAAERHGAPLLRVMTPLRPRGRWSILAAGLIDEGCSVERCDRCDHCGPVVAAPRCDDHPGCSCHPKCGAAANGWTLYAIRPSH